MSSRFKPKAWARAAWALGIFLSIGLIQILFAACALAGFASNLKGLGGLGQSRVNTTLILALSHEAQVPQEIMRGPFVWAIQLVPILGRYAQGIQSASNFAHAFGRATEDVIDYTSQSENTGRGTLTANGWKRVTNDYVSAIDLTRHDVKNLQELMPELKSMGVWPSNLGKQSLAFLLSDARQYLVAAREIFGQTGVRRWFLANQNLAEARGTGGLIGSFAVLRIENGGFALEGSGSDVDLTRLGPVVQRNLGIAPGAIWGMVNQADWRDLNASANPSIAAKQISDSWLAHTGQRLDGVVFAGQGITRLAVAAFGPLVIDGTTLSDSNIPMYLARDIYGEHPNPSDKNAFVNKFLLTLVGRIAHTRPNGRALLKAFANPTTGDKLWVWAAGDHRRDVLASAGLLGALNRGQQDSTLVTINNAGGNKLDAYSHILNQLSLCRRQKTATLTTALFNSAPSSGLPAYTSPRLDLHKGQTRQLGSNRDLLSVYLPKGAQLEAFYVDGKSVSAGDNEDTGREVLVFDLDTKPGARHKVQIKFNYRMAPRSNSKYLLDSGAQFTVPNNKVVEASCG